MKRNMLMVVLGVVLCVWSGAEPDQRPMSFDTASEDVREFVLYSITSCVRTASVGLVQRRQWDTFTLARKDAALSRQLDITTILRLGPPFRCIEMFKGDTSLYGRKLQFYGTPRKSGEEPWLVKNFAPDELGPGEFWYWDRKVNDDPVKKGKGREALWRISPPYDPFDVGFNGEYVLLALTTPVHEPMKQRIWLGDSYLMATNEVLRVLGKDDLSTIPSKELLRRLELEDVFSNRVHRLNEGCVFLVDHPEADVKSWSVQEQRLVWDVDSFRNARQNCGHLIRLTHEEVSEVVYLAYAANGETAGYATAQRRCADILKPVTEIRTTIGRRLQAMLRDGGMLSRTDEEGKNGSSAQFTPDGASPEKDGTE